VERLEEPQFEAKNPGWSLDKAANGATSADDARHRLADDEHNLLSHAFYPPVVVLVLGLGLGWAFSGFRNDKRSGG
jgi:hypothetical protein